ncbi:S8 family peptidase [Litchfieldia salsa]|uniref:Subtilase family protein n=1 Tax=Litchfieldia salsa TaxID=930152 RepID=A0A1H0WQA9_9BACI|nr:S8 family peptidase [Litchfieldia salsa]SDP92456.1 Subtilase family protein [Litchfieldia salsa]
MNKNNRYGRSIAILLGLLLVVLLPFFNRIDNDHDATFESNRNRLPHNEYRVNQFDDRRSTSPFKFGDIENPSQQDHSKAKIMDVDSILLYESTKDELNTDESITIIPHTGTTENSHYVNQQVVVDFKKGQLPTDNELDVMAKEINGKLLKRFNSSFIFKSDTLSTIELQSYFTKRTDVDIVEPNFILIQNEQSEAFSNGPNDRLYQRYQWNLPMIQAESGWGISRGTEDVRIAVLDTGVDLDHPDLVGRLTKGYNIVDNTNLPDDDNGHGTHVAGVIASETNNKEGVAGITWFNPIMPIKVMGNEGYGSSFDIANGIIWATDNGADVINLSLGNYRDSDLLHEAVTYAFNHDVVVIAASGNDNTDHPSYPAAYPEVLSVSAIDYNGNKASFSNYGNYIDITAPGVHIPSTYLDSQYAALSGTSMATPHVAALAGLIRSVQPDMKNTEVMAIIKDTSIDIGAMGKDIYFGEGLINVSAALEAASNP